MTPVERRRWLAAGVAVGVLGLVIRIWLFQQPVNSDDVHYFHAASTATSLSELGDTSNANGMRLAVMALPAIYSNLFDSPRVAFYGTVYTYAILSFVGVWLFAWALSGPRAAAIAAALWATSYVAVSVDTRLIPDNLGTAFALIGLALVAAVGLREHARSTRAIALIAGAGGLVLWLAFCARESFFVFGGVGVAFGLLSRRRWLVTASVVGGLLVGFAMEWAWMKAVFDDGLLRWKIAFAYSADVAESGATNEASAFAGYSIGDLFLRYPRILASRSPADLVVFTIGLLGLVRWGLAWRDRRGLAKLGAAAVAYGFLAFGIVNLDPIVPLMREKLRYYATAAPFLALAVAELAEVALFAEVRSARFARWLDRRHRTPVLAGLVAVALLLCLRVTARGREFARNGNDGNWTAAARMVDDVAARQRDRMLFTDKRTGRVAAILLPRGWPQRTSDHWPESLEPGYVLLDWARINRNARAGRLLPTRYYRAIERDALVLRHRRRSEVLDVFFVGAEPIDRHPIEVDPYPGGWSGVCGSSREPFALTGSTPCDDGEVTWFSGGDLPWRSREGAAVEGGRFLEVVVAVRESKSGTLRGTLNTWGEDGRKRSQPMGTIQLGAEPGTYALWTYLPRPVASFRVILRGDADLGFEQIQTFVLERDPSDDVRGVGNPW